MAMLQHMMQRISPAQPRNRLIRNGGAAIDDKYGPQRRRADHLVWRNGDGGSRIAVGNRQKIGRWQAAYMRALGWCGRVLLRDRDGIIGHQSAAVADQLVDYR